ncbi:MAG TPA: MFS transporter [Gaiellaceae bacterium]|nr:MFS transporter [Gaiellaceae bacterium]
MSDFRRYWIGEALSNLGTRTGNIAYPLLALALTHSAALAGVLAFSRSAAWFVLALPAGALIDRLDRKKLMVICDLASALVLATVVVSLALHELTYAQLLTVAVVQGVFVVFFSLSESGAVRHLVADDDLPGAIAQNTARNSAAWLAGPPLGGVLYAVQRSLPFAADVVSYLASAAMLLSIRKPFHKAREREPWSARAHTREIREGVAWIWRQPFVRAAALIVGGANFMSNAGSLLMIIVARDRGASAPMIGFMMSAAAVGSLGGAIAATRLHRVFSPRAIVVTYPWLGAAAMLVLVFRQPPLAMGAIFGVWVFFGPTWDAIVEGRRLLLTPDEMQGRASSVVYLFALGGAALGPLVGGVLVTGFGGSEAFLAVGVFGVLLASAATLAPGLREMGQAASYPA